MAPKTGVSQTTETNKFLSEARRVFDVRMLKSGNTQEKREESVGNGVTLEHRRPDFAWQGGLKAVIFPGTS